MVRVECALVPEAARFAEYLREQGHEVTVTGTRIEIHSLTTAQASEGSRLYLAFQDQPARRLATRLSRVRGRPRP